MNRSDDDIPLIVMNSIIKFLIRLPILKKRMISGIPSGMYEYVIARTKYIDETVKEALRDETEQILILGAGFDSRGFVSHEMANNARMFEFDAPATQDAKIRR